MGIYGDGEKKRKKGQTDRAREGKLSALRNGSKPTTRMDWGDALPEMLAAVVLSATRAGGMVSFRVSRDGGALVLTVFLDGEKEDFVYNQNDELDVELEKIAIGLDALRD